MGALHAHLRRRQEHGEGARRAQATRPLSAQRHFAIVLRNGAHGHEKADRTVAEIVTHDGIATSEALTEVPREQKVREATADADVERERHEAAPWLQALLAVHDHVVLARVLRIGNEPRLHARRRIVEARADASLPLRHRLRRDVGGNDDRGSGVQVLLLLLLGSDFSEHCGLHDGVEIGHDSSKKTKSGRGTILKYGKRMPEHVTIDVPTCPSDFLESAHALRISAPWNRANVMLLYCTEYTNRTHA